MDQAGVWIILLLVNLATCTDEDEFFVSKFEDVGVTNLENGSAIIPCRVTSPDIEVTLLKDTELVPEGKQKNRNMVVTYYPTVGFLLDPVTIIDGGNYQCIGKRRNGTEQDTTFYVLTYLDKKTYAMKPTVNGTETVYLREGMELVLRCTGHASESKFEIYWNGPNNQKLNSENVTAPYICNNNYKCKNATLRLPSINLKDSGIYTCVVNSGGMKANFSREVKVIEKTKTLIKLTSISNEIIYVKNKTAKIVVDFLAPEKPRLTWYGPQDKDLRGKGSKYQITHPDNQIILTINNADPRDAGMYSLKGEDIAGGRSDVAWLNRTIVIQAPPVVTLKREESVLYPLKSTVRFKCEVHSPAPVEIRWYFMGCDLNKPGDCEGDKFQSKGNTIRKKIPDVVYIEDFSFLIYEGILKCSANNSFGEKFDTVRLYVTDLENSTELVKILGKPEEEVVVGDNFTLSCASTVYNRTSYPQWEKNNNKLNATGENRTTHTYYSHLTFHNISKKDSGTYLCYAEDADSDSVFINVQDYESPTITETTLNGKDLDVVFGESVRMVCKAKGIPTPTIKWYKGDKEIDHKFAGINFGDKNKNSLYIPVVKPEQTGIYKCVASSRMNKVERQMKLSVQDVTQVSLVTKILLGICIPAILIMLIVIIVKFRREKKIQEELNLAGLGHFEKGQMESINPELPPDEQADLLPYDRSWEFPREKLRLGKQLGAGAFGVVMKAEALGILDHEEKTTVAVKMIRSGADRSYIKALASELKIMTHLGKHLNVVNLLGASTKNLAKMELMVIVEFCRYGNVHNYLLRHRDDFVDQLDRTTGDFNMSLGMEKLSRLQSTKSKTTLKRRLLSYTTSNAAGGSHSGNSTTDVGPPSPFPVEMSPIGSDMTVVSSPTGEPDECLLSSSSEQPEWRVKYHGDYKGSGPVCSQDLLCWSFQVAAGMEYLASRKVMHGDLAARNILLSDNNVVKICDFGLAKSMYKSNNYRKKSSGPLPIKWMALESIRDRVFSTQSDVWSYGIVLWELFSLARTPYPGMEADERLYNKLLEGYRMEQPPYATNAIYKVMLQCWDASPGKRPSFTELVEKLGAIDENIRRHYEEMNNPYIDMNERNSQSDYLSMMSAPNYSNMVAPTGSNHDYINSPGSQQKDGRRDVRSLSPDGSVFFYAGDGDNSGYLSMGGKDGIFSPGHVDECPFDFSLNKMKNAQELKLARKDNYVNMGQNAHPPTSFENPSYVMSNLPS